MATRKGNGINSSHKTTDEFAYGLNSQRNSLAKHLLHFKASRIGASCLLSGRRNSGKTLILNSLIQQHFPIGAGVRILNIEGAECQNAASKSAKLMEQLELGTTIEEECEKEPKLIVVDHFEHFALKQQQNFLYSVLNGSQTRPWFVILIGTTENSTNLLEKRVKSRLSLLRINFNVSFSFEQITDGFGQLLDRSSIPEQTKKELKDDANCTNLLRDLHCRHTGFCYVKKIVTLFECVWPKYAGREMRPSFLLGLCLEAVLPTNEQQRTLSSLSLRHLCLLNCLAKMDSSMCGRPRIAFTYQEIANAYIRFTNERDRSMHVHSFVLYRDLDELASIGVLSLTKGSDFGQIQFRKVSSNIEADAIVKTIGRGKIPSRVEEWILSTELH